MVRGNCVKWLMEWPKTHIRLGKGLQRLRRTIGATLRPPIVRHSMPPQKIVRKKPVPQAAVSTTRKEPAAVANTNHHQKLLGMSVPHCRPKPTMLHLNLITTVMIMVRIISTSMTSSTLVPTKISTCFLWMRNPSALTVIQLVVLLHACSA